MSMTMKKLDRVALVHDLIRNLIRLEATFAFSPPEIPLAKLVKKPTKRMTTRVKKEPKTMRISKSQESMCPMPARSKKAAPKVKKPRSIAVKRLGHGAKARARKTPMKRMNRKRPAKKAASKHAMSRCG